MKPMLSIYLCIAVAFSASGCGRREKVEVGRMKDASRLKKTLSRLETKVNQDPQLHQEVEAVLKRYGAGVQTCLPAEAKATQLYGILTDPQARASRATEALRLFVKMDAAEPVRESLLHKNRSVVIIASDALADQGAKGVKDRAALAYLIYVLSHNNYLQQGSEDATVHRIMKRKLIEAIRRIADLDMNVSEIDVDRTQDVERVLTMARAWARQKGIRLFEPNEPAASRR